MVPLGETTIVRRNGIPQYARAVAVAVMSDCLLACLSACLSESARRWLPAIQRLCASSGGGEGEKTPSRVAFPLLGSLHTYIESSDIDRASKLDTKMYLGPHTVFVHFADSPRGQMVPCPFIVGTCIWPNGFTACLHR